MSLPGVIVEHRSIYEKGGTLSEHHRIGNGLSARPHELSSLIKLFNALRQGFGQVIRPYCSYSFILEFNLTNHPVGPKKMVHRLQGHDLAEPCELVIDKIQ